MDVMHAQAMKVCTVPGCTSPVMARALCHNHYQRWRTRQKGYGRFTSLYVDAAPVLEHLEHLRRTGIGLRPLAAASGVSRRALQRLSAHTPNTPPHPRPNSHSASGSGQGSGLRPPTKVLRTTADAILAVRTVEPAPSALVPETGTRRRLQALIALGWPQTRIAHELGIETTNLSRMVHGRCKHVTAARATEVGELYTRWEMTPGPSRRARAQAARYHWAPPLAWDEHALDDPDATPCPH
ncbi:hypothetical protein R3Q06_35215 [Rhodococcus erythropolis]|uniref:hypothetical protein n=1 Tax=Rhodococcus erythropolis TaxID=1833 RepID=UPI002949D8E7|nr:hypothetical protein [Rhodococcus erythropolis]MDV6278636.1 hypothetical protein [Rhodococcus erythropolis]